MGNDKISFGYFCLKLTPTVQQVYTWSTKKIIPNGHFFWNLIHVVNSLIYSTKQMTQNIEASDKTRSLEERCQIKNICKWKFYHVIETFKKYYWD